VRRDLRDGLAVDLRVVLLVADDGARDDGERRALKLFELRLGVLLVLFAFLPGRRAGLELGLNRVGKVKLNERPLNAHPAVRPDHHADALVGESLVLRLDLRRRKHLRAGAKDVAAGEERQDEDRG
jgi:hypothetical protein